MVATVVPITSASSTLEYFRLDGGYGQHDLEHRRASRWYGDAAQSLGLRGTVTADSFEKVLHGFVPGTGLRLGRIRDGQHQHRPGAHLVFSAPKSVSVTALVYEDERVRRAHDRAVRETMDFAERYLLASREYDSTTRRQLRVRANGAVIALFRHVASRARDPQLHTHAVVLNVTRSAAGRWRSIDFAGLHNARHLLGAHYRNVLAARLRSHGYALVPSMAGHLVAFEIAGYGPEHLDAYSSRRLEIVRYMDEKGWRHSAANAQRANLATRQRKVASTHAELTARWKAVASTFGLERDEVAMRARRGRITSDGFVLSPIEIVMRTAAELEERSAVFTATELLAHSLARSSGIHSADDIRAAITQLERDGHLQRTRRRTVRRAHVTDRTVAAEPAVIGEMQALLGVAVPVTDAVPVERALARAVPPLTDGQKLAVRAILLGSDGVLGVQASSRAASAHMLRAVLTLCGVRVIGLTPSADTARELSLETGIRSQTLQWCLARHRDVADGVAAAEQLAALRQAFAGAIIVVDRMTRVSSAQTRDLLRIAQRAGVARLVLVGDRHELRPADARQPLRLLEGAGMPMVLVDDLQHHGDQNMEALVRRLIADPAGLDLLGGHLVQVSSEELAPTAARMWLALSPEARDGTAVFAPTHTLCRNISRLIQEGLADEGALTGRTLEVDTLVDLHLTRAQRRDASHYRIGDVTVFHQSFKRYRITAGDACEVVAVDGPLVRLMHPDGRPRHFDPTGRLAYGLDLCETSRITIQAGDRIRWTRDDNARALLDGSEATIVAIARRTLDVRTADGRTLRLRHDDAQLRHITLAYASNVAADAAAAARTIVVLDSGHGTLADQAALYQQICCARGHAVFLTDNLQDLTDALVEQTGMLLPRSLGAEEPYEPIEVVGLRVQAAMRVSHSKLAKKAPHPARRSVERWGAIVDRWCRERDYHHTAAVRIGVHASRYPGHDGLMRRLREIGDAAGFPEALRARLDKELARAEDVSRAPALLRQRAARMTGITAVRDEILSTDAEPDPTRDPRYETWRDACEQAVEDDLDWLDRRDLGLVTLAEGRTTLVKALRVARNVIVTDNGHIAMQSSVAAAMDWIRQWDSRLFTTPRPRQSAHAEQIGWGELRAGASELLSDGRLPGRWRQDIQGRIDGHVARERCDALVDQWARCETESDAQGMSIHEHRDAPGLVRRTQDLIVDPKIGTLGRGKLQPRLRGHAAWDAVQTRFKDLCARRDRLRDAPPAGEDSWYAHELAPNLIKEARPMTDDALLTTAQRKELKDEVTRFDSWQHERDARLACEAWEPKQRRVAVLAAAAGVAFHAHPDAAAVTEEAQRLLPMEAMPAEKAALLQAHVQGRAAWDAVQARFRDWCARRDRLRDAPPAGEDSWYAHELAPGLIKEARHMADDALLTTAQRKELKDEVTRFDSWQHERDARLACEAWEPKQRRVAVLAAAAGVAFHAHPDAAAVTEEAQRLLPMEAMPAEKAALLQAHVQGRAAWDAVQARFRDWCARRDRLRDAPPAGEDSWYAHELAPGLIKEARHMADDALLTTAQRKELKDEVTRFDSWQHERDARLACEAWEPKQRRVAVLAAAAGVAFHAHPDAAAVTEEAQRLLPMEAMPAEKAALLQAHVQGRAAWDAVQTRFRDWCARRDRLRDAPPAGEDSWYAHELAPGLIKEARHMADDALLTTAQRKELKDEVTRFDSWQHERDARLACEAWEPKQRRVAVLAAAAGVAFHAHPDAAAVTEEAQRLLPMEAMPAEKAALLQAHVQGRAAWDAVQARFRDWCARRDRLRDAPPAGEDSWYAHELAPGLIKEARHMADDALLTTAQRKELKDEVTRFDSWQHERDARLACEAWEPKQRRVAVLAAAAGVAFHAHPDAAAVTEEAQRLLPMEAMPAEKAALLQAHVQGRAAWDAVQARFRDWCARRDRLRDAPPAGEDSWYAHELAPGLIKEARHMADDALLTTAQRKELKDEVTRFDSWQHERDARLACEAWEPKQRRVAVLAAAAGVAFHAHPDAAAVTEEAQRLLPMEAMPAEKAALLQAHVQGRAAWDAVQARFRDWCARRDRLRDAPPAGEDSWYAHELAPGLIKEARHMADDALLTTAQRKELKDEVTRFDSWQHERDARLACEAWEPKQRRVAVLAAAAGVAFHAHPDAAAVTEEAQRLLPMEAMPAEKAALLQAHVQGRAAWDAVQARFRDWCARRDRLRDAPPAGEDSWYAHELAPGLIKEARHMADDALLTTAQRKELKDEVTRFDSWQHERDARLACEAWEPKQRRVAVLAAAAGVAFHAHPDAAAVTEEAQRLLPMEAMPAEKTALLQAHVQGRAAWDAVQARFRDWCARRDRLRDAPPAGEDSWYAHELAPGLIKEARHMADDALLTTAQRKELKDEVTRFDSWQPRRDASPASYAAWDAKKQESGNPFEVAKLAIELAHDDALPAKQRAALRRWCAHLATRVITAIDETLNLQDAQLDPGDEALIERGTRIAARLTPYQRNLEALGKFADLLVSGGRLEPSEAASLQVRQQRAQARRDSVARFVALIKPGPDQSDQARRPPLLLGDKSLLRDAQALAADEDLAKAARRFLVDVQESLKPSSGPAPSM